MPVLRAAERPRLTSWRTTRTGRAQLVEDMAVSSVEPSSTTTTSKSRYVCASTLSIALGRARPVERRDHDAHCRRAHAVPFRAER